ncbi:MAG TPA: phenylalanine--tRNA ligase subunit beta, partial [Clostridia bacterium]|nr:phenylalanine--tRNA ligase subunit beta [Clostridia bacterium]
MKLPLNWLRQYVEIPVPVEEYQRKMIRIGNGVEGYEVLGAEIEKVVVGRILSIAKHANSDHLLICQVDVGDQTVQIVTGAPNVVEGALVPVALDGAKLPGGVKIKRGKLRGELSEGMLCSGVELNVPESLYPGAGVDGILLLSSDCALGTDIRAVVGLDDTVVDFEVLANRPDCLCAWGIARESAVALGTRFAKPEISVKTCGGSIHEYAKVEVLESALCPRYAARVIKNVRVAPSPLWLRKALHGAGMRSINNVVDITNYVMLETGHPMHAFDLDRVQGRHIIVRCAAPGEALKTLDDKERVLNESMLVIADEGGSTGLAGIMGGLESEITEETHTLLFECAAFDRTSIRLTSRGLGMRTESSGRFEKGVSPATVMEALERACQLVNLLDAGDVVDGAIDLYPNPQTPAEVVASCEGIRRRCGVDIPGERMAEILRDLHFSVRLEDDVLAATPPIFRQDVDGSADLSEEVLRVYGYDSLSSTLPTGAFEPGTRSKRMRLSDACKRLLNAWGGYEAITYSFISPAWIEKLQLAPEDPRRTPVALRNYLGEDTSIMRTTLVPSMLNVLALNQSRQVAEGLVYEIGAAFEGADRKPGELPRERQTLCIGAYGPKMDFYELREMAQALLRVQGVEAQIVPGADVYLHPNRCGRLTVGSQEIASLGELHPEVAENFELLGRVYLAVIDLDALLELRSPMGKVKELPKYPAVTRDVALVMAEDQPLGPVRDAIEAACRPLIEEVTLFDVYRNERLGGRKSAAFSLRLRAPDRTLTDEEVNAVFERMLARCAELFGAELRA